MCRRWPSIASHEMPLICGAAVRVGPCALPALTGTTTAIASARRTRCIGALLWGDGTNTGDEVFGVAEAGCGHTLVLFVVHGHVLPLELVQLSGDRIGSYA